VIQIEVEAQDPVEGWVREITRTRPVRPTREIRFSGWLGLLQAVVTMIGEASPQATGGLSRQLTAGGDADLAEDAPQMRGDRSSRDVEA
jgi:hypothetical protein